MRNGIARIARRGYALRGGEEPRGHSDLVLVGGERCPHRGIFLAKVRRRKLRNDYST